MRKCKSCGEKYRPERPSQRVCGKISCALAQGRADQEKAEKARQKARKAALRDNDRSLQMKLAQTAFNKFIRLRDMDKPCISCGRFHNGQYHAGHYRTTAAQGALRFNELNCHRQCAPCNNHKSGNITEYRIELVRRIGESLVEWLERDHGPNQLTVEEIRAIKEYYQNACKEMMLTPGEAEPF